MTKEITIDISESIGSVSGLLDEVDKPKALIILAHGAGAGMEHPFMEKLTVALKKNDLAVLRFQFPYMEQGKKRPDSPGIAQKTIEEVFEKAKSIYPSIPVFVSGKSYGGRMASHFAAKLKPSGLSGLIFFGFPLHAPGKPSVERAAHLKGVNVPMLFLQGTRDSLAKIDFIEEVVHPLKNTTLHIIEGGDHSFKIPKKVDKGYNEVIEDIADVTANWIDSIS